MAETNESSESTGGEKTEQPVGAGYGDKVQTSCATGGIDRDARMWAMICHLAGLAGYILPLIGNIVTPLIIWQIKKDDYPFVDEQGKEAVNFQISISLYTLISIPFCLICIGGFMVAAVVIIDLVFVLIAAVKANNGWHYRYPLCIRFIK